MNEGWIFLVDNSEFYFYKNKEVDILQDEFDAMMNAGTLDITKEYYTYEEE